jgi:3-oxosteroid 1-dehydrogenase
MGRVILIGSGRRRSQRGAGRGGPRNDAGGRVLNCDREPLPGLYAAGNAAARPFGTATTAGGAPLGPVFGFRLGEAAASDRRS